MALRVWQARIIGLFGGILIGIFGGFTPQIEFLAALVVLISVIEVLNAKRIIKGWWGGLISGFLIGYSFYVLLKTWNAP